MNNKNELQKVKKNGKPKTRKIDLTDWSNKENAEKWREHFATLCNQHLEKGSSPLSASIRDFNRQHDIYKILWLVINFQRRACGWFGNFAKSSGEATSESLLAARQLFA